MGTICVASSMVDLIPVIVANFTASHADQNSQLRVLTVIRLVRMLRILRLARLARYLQALRVLVFSIMATLRSLLWALVLLAMIFYGFGVAFTQAVANHCIGEVNDPLQAPQCNNEAVSLYWGSIADSMLTLFKAISAGLSWHDCVTPLHEVGSLWVVAFLFYICFSYFAVLNVVTAVFCQSAIEGANTDVELSAIRNLTLKRNFNSYTRVLFQNAISCLGYPPEVTLDELECMISMPEMKSCLEAFEIFVPNAWTLFKLLDKDRK